MVRVCMRIVMANSSSTSDPEGARNLGKASLGVSIAGVIVTVIIIIIVIAVNASAAQDTKY